MRPPWHSDHDLTSDGLGAALRSQFPTEFPDPAVVPLPVSWDYLTFKVDESWAFRVPKRRDIVPHMEAEFAILEAMQTLPVAVPQPRFHGVADAHVPHPFYGYPFIHGRFADDPRVSPESVIPDALAFLDALHRLPSPESLSTRRAKPWADRVATIRSVVEGLPELAPGVPWLLAHPPKWSQDVLLHHGLSPDALLVDPETHSLTAVLDWGEAALGDPAHDLGAMILWDPVATEKAHQAAGAAPETLRRAGVHALITGLEHLRHELRWDPTRARLRYAAVRAVLHHVCR